MDERHSAQAPEQGNVRLSRVLPLLALLAALILLVLAAAKGLSNLWDIEGPDSAARHVGHFPDPELESTPQPDLAAYLAKKEDIANSYAWVDRQNGIARIPVDLAMKALAQKSSVPAKKDAP